jgi:hypothetical protein
MSALIGISRTTLFYWKDIGVIAPSGYRKSYPLWEKPSQERINELRIASKQRQSEGARRGNQIARAKGGPSRGMERMREAVLANPEILKKGVVTRCKEMAEAPPCDLIDRIGLHEQSGVPLPTIDRWIRGGYITPAFVDPKWRKSWFTPLTQEDVADIRAKCRQTLREVGKRNMAQALEKWHGGTGKEHRLSSRPSVDHLMVEEVAEMIGERYSLVASATKEGSLSSVKVGRYKWVIRSDAETWNQQRLAKKAAKERPSSTQSPDQGSKPKNQAPIAPEVVYQKQKAATPKPSVLPSFTTRQKPQSTVRQQIRDFDSYDTAVEGGQANPAFQGPLGFNVLLNSKTGAYRSAAVNVVPADGWTYHQRHYRNGLGQWQIRTMSISGQVHL